MPGRSNGRRGDSGGEMVELMAMRAKDGETDLANVVALLRAIAIEHLIPSALGSDSRGVPLKLEY